ncbi:YfbR-like 5'-deoxynucleotidase [Priestia aryabhattai]|uniref:YfbR-like 5'-deoxynucleotidase n=1 Tax=Priestia aryabhattai TaxID=412384 RepID=UPI0039A34D26
MYLVTYTGKKIDYNNITKDCISMDDIFHSLPKINRFLGHSDRAYSVAEHTLQCLYMAHAMGYSDRLMLLTLIHDFAESYTGDCPTPLKRLLPEFQVIEKKFEVAICEHLGIEPATEEEHYWVKRIDSTMLAIEMRDLTKHDYMEYVGNHTIYTVMSGDMFKVKEKEYTDEELTLIISTEFTRLMDEYEEEDV